MSVGVSAAGAGDKGGEDQQGWVKGQHGLPQGWGAGMSARAADGDGPEGRAVQATLSSEGAAGAVTS